MKIFKKNKKGIMALEMVFLIIVSTIIIAFVLDLMILSWKTTVMSETVSMVTRTVGVQGGIRPSVPPNYPGFREAYNTSSDVHALVRANMRAAGIKDQDFRIYINNQQFTASGTPQFNYQEKIEIRAEMRFKWDMISFYFGETVHTAIQKRSTTAEYKANW